MPGILQHIDSWGKRQGRSYKYLKVLCVTFGSHYSVKKAKCGDGMADHVKIHIGVPAHHISSGCQVRLAN